MCTPCRHSDHDLPEIDTCNETEAVEKGSQENQGKESNKAVCFFASSNKTYSCDAPPGRCIDTKPSQAMCVVHRKKIWQQVSTYLSKKFQRRTVWSLDTDATMGFLIQESMLTISELWKACVTSSKFISSCCSIQQRLSKRQNSVFNHELFNH